jgi:hypothetical protein
MERVVSGRAITASASLPIAATVWFFAFPSGLLARTGLRRGGAGRHVRDDPRLGQFASVSILGTSGGAAAAITAAVLLNGRYVPISISIARSSRAPPAPDWLNHN